MSSAYTTAHGDAGSLTHWSRPAFKPMSSWIVVRLVSTEPQWEVRHWHFFEDYLLSGRMSLNLSSVFSCWGYDYAVSARITQKYYCVPFQLITSRDSWCWYNLLLELFTLIPWLIWDLLVSPWCHYSLSSCFWSRYFEFIQILFILIEFLLHEIADT